MTYLNIGFLSSHGGSNMQAVIEACKNGTLEAKPCVVISNNSNSKALERAGKEGIPNYHLSQKSFPVAEELDEQILTVLKKHEVNIVLLLGYMKKLGSKTLKEYKGSILNIHPSLLPKYGGKGMYGAYVHEAVLKSGDDITGVSIHLVDEGYDTGKIINQCIVPIKEGDTVDSLSERVLATEHEFIVETLIKINQGKIHLNNI
jgi:phosphoribosylglycinamide formyltransferase-1